MDVNVRATSFNQPTSSTLSPWRECRMMQTQPIPKESADIRSKLLLRSTPDGDLGMEKNCPMVQGCYA
jgi:hypothetical protein